MKRSIRRDEAGSVLVEFLAIIPVLLILAAIVLELGYYFLQRQQIVAGVRDAARYLARHPDPANAAGSAKLLAVTSEDEGERVYRLTWWREADVDVAVVPIARADPLEDAVGVYVESNVVLPGLGWLSVLGIGDSTFSVLQVEIREDG